MTFQSDLEIGSDGRFRESYLVDDDRCEVTGSMVYDDDKQTLKWRVASTAEKNCLPYGSTYDSVIEQLDADRAVVRFNPDPDTTERANLERVR